MSDIYDQEIELLRENPERIKFHWNHWSPLFSKAGLPGSRGIGCLTEIREYPDEDRAETPALTAAILADDRLPNNSDEITVEHLPIFAEWQRRIDQEINRIPIDSLDELNRLCEIHLNRQRAVELILGN